MPILRRALHTDTTYLARLTVVRFLHAEPVRARDRSLLRRHACAGERVARGVPRARADVMGMVGGVVIALVVMMLHRVIFGHAVVPFGL